MIWFRNLWYSLVFFEILRVASPNPRGESPGNAFEILTVCWTKLRRRWFYGWCQAIYALSGCFMKKCCFNCDPSVWSLTCSLMLSVGLFIVRCQSSLPAYRWIQSSWFNLCSFCVYCMSIYLLLCLVLLYDPSIILNMCRSELVWWIDHYLASNSCHPYIHTKNGRNMSVYIICLHAPCTHENMPELHVLSTETTAFRFKATCVRCFISFGQFQLQSRKISVVGTEARTFGHPRYWHHALLQDPPSKIWTMDKPQVFTEGSSSSCQPMSGTIGSKNLSSANGTWWKLILALVDRKWIWQGFELVNTDVSGDSLSHPSVYRIAWEWWYSSRWEVLPELTPSI